MTTKYQFNNEGLSKGLCTPECATYDSEFCYRVKDGKGEVVAGFDNESDARFFIAMRNGGARALWDACRFHELNYTNEVKDGFCEDIYYLKDGEKPGPALAVLLSSGVVHQVKEGE